MKPIKGGLNKKIEKGIYWDRAWSLVENCSKVSEGCLNCWLESMNKRFGRHSDIVRFREDRLDIPLKTKKPQVFAIWSDLFHEKVFDIEIQAAYLAMLEAKQHIFLILTKRPERMSRIIKIDTGHIWHGVTCENQQRANERIPYLLQVPGNRFLSLEPLLESINLFNSVPAVFGTLNHLPYIGNIHQVIVGSESGPRRRPCKIEWIRSVVEQCKEAGVPCFVKQIHDEKGKVVKDINLFPEDLRVRELAWN